jgi:hypothetical protein
MPDVSFPDDDDVPESSPAPAPKAVEREPAESPVAPEPKSEPAAPAESAPAKVTEQPKATEKTPAAGRAEALAKLTSDATNGDEPAAEPEAKEKTPAAETPAASEPETKPTEEPDEDKLDRPLTDDEAKDKTRTKQRFDEILADRRTLRAPAKLGQSILETCAKANMPPEEFGNWVGLCLALKRGDPEAVADLEKVLNEFKGVTAAPAKTETPAPATVSGKLPEWLQAKVDNFEMSAATADEINSKIAQPAAAPAAPKNSPPAQTEQRPIIQRADPSVLRVQNDIGKLEAKWESEFKTDWPVIRAKAWAIVQKKGKAAPDALIERVEGAVNTVVAEMRAKATHRPPPPPRITASTTAAPTTGTNKTGRAEALKNLTH